MSGTSSQTSCSSLSGKGFTHARYLVWFPWWHVREHSVQFVQFVHSPLTNDKRSECVRLGFTFHALAHNSCLLPLVLQNDFRDISDISRKFCSVDYHMYAKRLAPQFLFYKLNKLKWYHVSISEVIFYNLVQRESAIYVYPATRQDI